MWGEYICPRLETQTSKCNTPNVFIIAPCVFYLDTFLMWTHFTGLAECVASIKSRAPAHHGILSLFPGLQVVKEAKKVARREAVLKASGPGWQLRLLVTHSTGFPPGSQLWLMLCHRRDKAIIWDCCDCSQPPCSVYPIAMEAPRWISPEVGNGRYVSLFSFSLCGCAHPPNLWWRNSLSLYLLLQDTALLFSSTNSFWHFFHLIWRFWFPQRSLPFHHDPTCDIGISSWKEEVGGNAGRKTKTNWNTHTHTPQYLSALPGHSMSVFWVGK